MRVGYAQTNSNTGIINPFTFKGCNTATVLVRGHKETTGDSARWWGVCVRVCVKDDSDAQGQKMAIGEREEENSGRVDRMVQGTGSITQVRVRGNVKAINME